MQEPGIATQFHSLLRSSDGSENIWVALPLPHTVVSFKAEFHRACRIEEQRRLTAAGETVLALPLSM